MTTIDDQRHDIFIGIARVLARLGRSRAFLTRPQCVALAELARDVADELDLGEGDRIRRLRCVGSDQMGPLFRLVSEEPAARLPLDPRGRRRRRSGSSGPAAVSRIMAAAVRAAARCYCQATARPRPAARRRPHRARGRV
jgi:hypothetical protein